MKKTCDENCSIESRSKSSNPNNNESRELSFQIEIYKRFSWDFHHFNESTLHSNPKWFNGAIFSSSLNVDDGLAFSMRQLKWSHAERENSNTKQTDENSTHKIQFSSRYILRNSLMVHSISNDDDDFAPLRIVVVSKSTNRKIEKFNNFHHLSFLLVQTTRRRK